MPAKDAAERSTLAQIAALERWLKEPNRAEALTAAREAAGDALTARLEREVDPDEVLDPAERARLVETARKLHFARLADASHKARRARRLADRLAALASDAA